MSNGSLGTLSIDVLANIASMVSDLGKAQDANTAHAKKFAKDWQDSIGAVQDSFKSLAELAGISFSVAGIVEIGKQALDTSEKIQNLSQAFGFSTQTMQVAGYAAALVGGNFDTASAALARLARAAEQAIAGNVQQVEAFHSLGIEANNLAELLKNPDQLLVTVAQHVAAAGDGFGKTAAVMQIFGRGAAELIPFLNELGANYEELRKRAENLGIVLSSQDQTALAQAKEGFNELGQAALGAGNLFTIAMLPAINAVSETLNEFAASGAVKSFFTGLGTDVSQFVVVAGQIKDAIGGWITAFQALAGVHPLEGARRDLVGFVQDTLDEQAKFWYSWSSGLYQLDIWFSERFADAENIVIQFIRTSIGYLADFSAQASKALFFVQPDASASLAALSQSLRTMVSGLKEVAADTSTYTAEIDKNDAALSAAVSSNQEWADSTRLTASAFSVLTAGLDGFQQSLVKGDVVGNAAKLQAAMAGVRQEASALIAEGAYEKKVTDDMGQEFAILANMVKQADAAQVNYNANQKAGQAALKAYQTELNKLADLESQLASGLGGPYLAALKTYEAGIDETAKTWQSAYDAGKANDELLGRLSDDQEKLWERLQQTNAQIKAQHDLFAQETADLNDLIRVHAAATTQQAALADGLKKYDELMKSHYDFYGNYIEDENKLKAALDSQLPSYIANKQAINDLTQQFKLQEEAAKQWQGIWATAGNGVADTFAKVLVEGGSLFNGLKDLAKQTVEAIISYFAKLAVINPILNSIFGGSAGFSLLPSLASAASSGFNESGSGTGAIGSILGSAGSAGGASGGGLFDAGSWIGAGKNLFSGFSSLWSGSPGVSGVSSGMFGTVVNDSGAMTFTPSLLGNAISLGGGILAAWNEYKSGGGVIGAAAYGIGTITAAGALGGIATGAGAAAGAAGGLGAIGLGAIPVVGWIALAAMIVDKISGGKLFGTSGQVVGGNQVLNIGNGGADVESVYTTKGQRALFGGSYWKEHSTPTDPATVQAANDFFAALKSGTEEFAKSLGATAADIVGGSFKTNFDKNGKVTSTSDTVLGVTRTGETQQQFAERLQADSFLAVLDKMGLGASDFVAGLQGDADKLFAGVQDFAQAVTLANTDLGNGFHFLALSGNATLVDVMKWVEGLEGSGETLTQAYTRLAQAQQQYNQFVAQFKPGTVYVDDFEGGMSKLYAQMQANIAQANALAVAAGAAGASQQDLTNIQQYAAQQMAALTVQLEASAQSLAFSLGVTDQGSLDQTNQAISAIVSAAKNATTATADTSSSLTIASKNLANFGGAVTSVAQQSAAAVALLLGNLSTLNDQQKLQLALTDLQQGVGGVTKDQVLQIGQQLYASSQAYVNLFNEVMAIPDKTASSSKGGKGGGKSVASGSIQAPSDWTDSSAQWASTGLTLAQWNSMSADNKQKLQDLLSKQDTLSKAATTQQFQTLAQQIAEIASAKGEDFTKVISDMGIKQADLEKGLGLQSDAALKAYIQNLQQQTDSANQNTTSIVDAINMLPQKLADALGGKTGTLSAGPSRPTPVPITPSDGSSGSSGSTTPGRGVTPPTSGKGGYLTQQDYDGIAQASMRAFAPYYSQAMAGQRANTRTPVAVR